MTILLRGRRYDSGEVVEVTVADGAISRIEPVQADAGAARPPWLSQGLVDLQVNGFGGREFNDLRLNAEMVVEMSRALDRDGITSYCPTATTHSFEMLSHTFSVLADACDESPEVACRVAGFHLEGPYISVEDGPRGAHPREHCRPPDWDEFRRLQDAARGRIRILTMSPEYEGSAAFIAQVVGSGVLVAIGHTAADSQQIRAAVDAGARMSTHLGNGAHAQIRRHPNYIWDQLAEDRLTASLIVDGHHLPPAVVKTFIRAKGAHRCVLVSDLTGMAGMPPGRYRNSSIGDIEVLDDGRLVIAGQRQLLAGASLPITVGVANLIRFAQVDLATAIDMASVYPAALIGHVPGELEVGARADLIQFELPPDDTGPIRIVATINSGQLVYGTPQGS